MKHLTWVVAVAALGLIAWRGSAMDGAEEAAIRLQDGSVFATIAPFHSYGHVHDADNVESMRPRVMGTHGVISSGHYLATQAGYDVLRAGGNAFDAGVTAGMALKALKMDYAGWTGVAPLILYSAAEDRVITRVGAGTSPALATLDYFLEHGKSPINNALIPADVDVWLAALDRFGTLSFSEAAQPTLRIAEEGYHLYKMQKWMIEDQMEGILAFPYNRDFWFQNGVGEQRLGDPHGKRGPGAAHPLHDGGGAAGAGLGREAAPKASAPRATPSTRAIPRAMSTASSGRSAESCATRIWPDTRAGGRSLWARASRATTFTRATDGARGRASS